MSVTVHDHRKYLAEAAAKASAENAAVHIPIEQVASPDATTGDDKLDKMVRGIQAIIDALTPQIQDIAIKAMAAPNHDMLDMCRREYWFKFGQRETLKEIIKLPAQIMVEAQMK